MFSSYQIAIIEKICLKLLAERKLFVAHPPNLKSTERHRFLIRYWKFFPLILKILEKKCNSAKYSIANVFYTLHGLLVICDGIMRERKRTVDLWKRSLSHSPLYFFVKRSNDRLPSTYRSYCSDINVCAMKHSQFRLIIERVDISENQSDFRENLFVI